MPSKGCAVGCLPAISSRVHGRGYVAGTHGSSGATLSNGSVVGSPRGSRVPSRGVHCAQVSAVCLAEAKQGAHEDAMKWHSIGAMQEACAEAVCPARLSSVAKKRQCAQQGYAVCSNGCKGSVITKIRGYHNGAIKIGTSHRF